MIWFWVAMVSQLGCTPSCDEVCDKLLSCDQVETPMISSEECSNACRAQEELYIEWDDTQKQDAFDAYKTCVDNRSCKNIANGACYDEDLYIW